MDTEALLKEPSTFVLDVRTPQEFRTGALPRAILIPVDELKNRVDELPENKTTPILVYCAHGVRSLYAQSFLKSQGYSAVYNLQGGLAAYEQSVKIAP
jgi:rhodanese-related sulfurtransferase